MSRILVSVTPAPGHVNPMLLIAEDLAKRGHEVTFNTGEVFREKAEAAGLSFVPLQGIANFDFHRLDEVFPERKTFPGIQQVDYDMKHIFGDMIPDQYRGMQEIIDQQNIDLVLVDLLFLGSFPLLMKPKESRPPVISCGIIVYWLRTPETSPFTGPDSTPEGLIRNAEHNRQLGEALAGSTAYVDEILKPFGATDSVGLLFDATCTRPEVFLEYSAEEFEYPIKNKQKNLHFVGPLTPKVQGGAEEPDWLKEIDGSKPVILVTQGTISNSDFNQIVNPAIQALADADVQVIVTAGGGDVSTIHSSPNARVERYVSYHHVLPKADIFITNGGYNGVQQALSFGVPVISGGTTEDKPFVSARVAWSGGGINLHTGTPTAEQIRAAVYEILADRKYRDRAKELAKSFAKYDSLATTSKIVESTIAESTKEAVSLIGS
ncbi:MAG TPA: glycosyltransferase [Edaphobacter sp.]|nr:glycosyltransferase [Edaphobacter sp.]